MVMDRGLGTRPQQSRKLKNWIILTILANSPSKVQKKYSLHLSILLRLFYRIHKDGSSMSEQYEKYEPRNQKTILGNFA